MQTNINLFLFIYNMNELINGLIYDKHSSIGERNIFYNAMILFICEICRDESDIN